MNSKPNLKLTSGSLGDTPLAFSNGQTKHSSALKEVYSDGMIRLYHGDCKEVIKHLDDNSIQFANCSPPYNVNLGKNKLKKKGYDIYKDNKKHAKYIDWLRTIFLTLYPKLERGGRVAINIGDGKNGRISTHSDIIQFMSEIGYLPFGHLIWNKSQIGNRCAWGSWLSPSCPSFPTPFEHILIFAKESLKLQTKGKTDLTKEEFIDWSLALWNIAPETQMKKYRHNAMFPVELPRRLIKKLTWVGSTVLDMFNGAGSTGLACQQLGRKYVGIELSKKYCRVSVRRWEQAKKAA